MSEPQVAAGRRQLDRLELIALAYLGLPLLMWVATWLRAPVAAALVAALVFSGWTVARRARWADRPELALRTWLIACLVAALWISLSGLAGGLRPNEDWLVRLPVLRDLTVGAWPVAYGPAPDGGELVLRFPMAYYMVPAALGKVLGVATARPALWLWTVLGVTLFFALSLSAWKERTARHTVVILGVLVMFSGLDLLGWLYNQGRWPALGQHIEWWTWMFQYSSQTSLVFWAPNHALPAWLAALVVWRHRERGLAMAPMALLLLTVAAWAPLVALGSAPLLLACSLRGQPLLRTVREALHPAVLAVLPVVLVLGLFVTFGVPGRDRALNDSIAEIHRGTLFYIIPYLLTFAVVEWLALAVVLWRLGLRSWLLWGAAAVLLLLPTQRFGPGNDIVMRGGITALTLLMLLTVAALLSPDIPRRGRALIAAFLLVGAAAPVQEVLRAFTPHKPTPDPAAHLIQLYGKPWHYVGSLSPGLMKDLLRPPVPILPGR